MSSSFVWVRDLGFLASLCFLFSASLTAQWYSSTLCSYGLNCFSFQVTPATLSACKLTSTLTFLIFPYPAQFSYGYYFLFLNTEFNLISFSISFVLIAPWTYFIIYAYSVIIIYFLLPWGQSFIPYFIFHISSGNHRSWHVADTQ